MIQGFFLSVVLCACASLCWGFVFSLDVVRLGRRLLIASILISVVLSIFAAIFFLKGLVGLGNNLDIVVTSIVFAVTFLLSLAAGFVLSNNPGSVRIFSYTQNLLRGSDNKDGRDEIIDEILDLSSESGQIDVLERELIESVLKFNDKIVREVMVPRGDVVAIDIDVDARRLLHSVIEEGYSRLPVFRESIDNIVGIIYAKDLLTMVEDGPVIVLQDLVRPPYYVPVTKKISELLREMQRDKVHLAVVVDEFGGTEGIVTLEDVLEEIVGEIQDEYDENLSELVRDSNEDVHVAGSMTVNRFNELLGADVPQGEDYDTIAGFVQKLAGKLPQKDEIYNHEEMFFIVEDVARHRIKRLRVSFKEHPVQFSAKAEAGREISGLAGTQPSRQFQREGVDLNEADQKTRNSPRGSADRRKRSATDSRGKAKTVRRTRKRKS